MQNKKNKICHIASADMAVKFLLLNQLKFLKNQGYDVYVVCPTGKFIEEIEAEGIKVKNISFNRGLNPFLHAITLVKLFFYFYKEKFDIVHTHNPVPGLVGQLAAKAAGVPIIINTIHGLYFTENSAYLKRKIFVFLEKVAASCSTLIFSQNKEDLKTIIKERICKPEKIKYLGNGIDLERFNPNKFSKGDIEDKKRKLGIASDRVVVGIVGRLVREKGYLDLFDAFKEILIKFPKALLVSVGPLEPAKKDAINPELIKEHNIRENVLFLGERTDVDEIYPLMDVFVLPSWREGFPRSVIEAGAMGRPIICTDVRGCREAVIDKETGILVPAKNPPKLALAIVSLLSNKKEADRLGNNAREMAIKSFDERQIFDIIKSNYETLLNDE
jgi:glycosyltransferase involved in cell wall biosynthesis